jgi:hypothetical protein
VALGCVGAARAELVERAPQSRQEVGRSEHAHAGGGELDRERHAVELPYKLCDGGGVFIAQRVVVIVIAHAVDEERDRVRLA